MKKEEFVTWLTETVANHPSNRQEDGIPYFDAPQIGFASGNDPLFTELKTVIGPYHKTPVEAFEEEHHRKPKVATVISWSLPINEATRIDQRAETRMPSRRWSRTRNYGQMFIDELSLLALEHLRKHHIKAVAPFLMPTFKNWVEEGFGWTSNWSERHAAFAAGLGTFSLNDALITERGIAHRLGSVVAEVELAPTPREADIRGNCLYFANGTCKACVKRCPHEALSEKGHDKSRCFAYCYEVLPPLVAEKYGVRVTGCGLCQTKVPCEFSVPKGIRG